MPHAPPEQVAVPFAAPGQALPQAPQLPTLVSLSTQLPPHAVVPAGHALMHLPAAHDSVAPQCTLQPPQFAGSVCT